VPQPHSDIKHAYLSSQCYKTGNLLHNIVSIVMVTYDRDSAVQ